MTTSVPVDRQHGVRHRAPRLRLVTLDASGHTLVELLLAAGILAILASISIPQLTTGMERGRARAAARYLAGRMASARAEAVARATTVALRFRAEGPGLTLATFADGNRNGVRADDIAAGADRRLEGDVRLEDLFPGVVIGTPQDGDTAAVLGDTEILSFTPAGTATSATIHVLGRDGSQFAIRILGVTGRIRLQRLDATSGRWIDSL